MPNVELTVSNYHLNKNQKVFCVHKIREKRSNTDIRVSDIFKDDIFYASKNLSEKGFKLYMYLLTNQDGYIGGLSKADVTEKTGISDSSYNRAVLELIEKHFLIYRKCMVSDNYGIKCPLYDFYARPDLYSN